MDLKLDRQERKQFQEALLDAFRRPIDLARLVRDGLDVNLSTITVESDLSQAVFDLYDWAESHGQMEQLLRVALDANPSNPRLVQFAGTLGFDPNIVPAAPITGTARGVESEIAALRAEIAQLRAELAAAQQEAVVAKEREEVARAEVGREKRVRQAAERRLKQDTAAIRPRAVQIPAQAEHTPLGLPPILKPEQRQQFEEALQHAFPQGHELEQIILHGLGADPGIINTTELGTSYQLLLAWAERWGRLEDLVWAAVDANPGNPKLRAFIGQFDRRASGLR